MLKMHCSLSPLLIGCISSTVAVGAFASQVIVGQAEANQGSANALGATQQTPGGEDKANAPSAEEVAAKAIQTGDVPALKKAIVAGVDFQKKLKSHSDLSLPDLTLMQLVLTTPAPGESEPSETVLDQRDKLVAEMLELVLAAGGKTSIPDALSKAIMFNGRTNVVSVLLAHGHSAIAPAGRAGPLYFAYEVGSSAVQELLIKARAQPYSAEQAKQIGLVGAASRGQLARVSALIDAGADPNKAEMFGDTPLFAATRVGDSKAMELLLKFKADPNKASGRPSYLGNTIPLIESVEGGAIAAGKNGSSPRAVERALLLLGFGADVSAERSSDGQTALHVAARYGDRKIATLLLQFDAKIAPQDKQGKTPLDLAQDGPMIKFLKEHGAKERGEK